jgi:hypothetical protein
MTRTDLKTPTTSNHKHDHGLGQVDIVLSGKAAATHTHPEIAALEARIAALEKPPVIVPVPPTLPKDLQAAINATASGGTLDLTGGTWTGSFRLTKAITIIGGTIIGARGGTTYVGDDCGLIALAQGSPISKIVVRGTTLRGYGDSGIWLRYADRVEIDDVTIEDCVYSGIMVLSATGGWIRRAKVRRIGVVGASANGNNAYGIALSQQLPASERPTSDFMVEDSLVEDVPTWHGLDTHSGVRCTFRNNTVNRCRHGIFITGYTTKRNIDVIVDGNVITAPTGADQYGITNVYGTGGRITDNTIKGYPANHAVLVTNGAPVDPESVNPTLVVSGNTVP